MNTYNQAELSNLKIADITALYNDFATVTGAKQIKKFSDKTTAIKRILQIQEIAAPYIDVEPEPEATEAPEPETTEAPEPETTEAPEPETTEAVKPPKKAKAAKEAKPEGKTFTMLVGADTLTYNVEETTVTVEKEAKEGTLAASIIQAVKDSIDGSFTEVADNLIASYSRPKSAKTVDQAFAIRKIKKAAQKGFVKLV